MERCVEGAKIRSIGGSNVAQHGRVRSNMHAHCCNAEGGANVPGIGTALEEQIPARIFSCYQTERTSTHDRLESRNNCKTIESFYGKTISRLLSEVNDSYASLLITNTFSF